MKSGIIPALFTALFLLATCGDKSSSTKPVELPDTSIDMEAEKASAEAVIRNSIAWALDNKNLTLLYNGLYQTEALFIFNPDDSEQLGFAAFSRHAESVFMSDAFAATGYEMRDMRITLSDDASMGWFFTILDDHYEINGIPGAWLDTRYTGVLIKEGRRWVIAQMHYSFSHEG